MRQRGSFILQRLPFLSNETPRKYSWLDMENMSPKNPDELSSDFILSGQMKTLKREAQEELVVTHIYMTLYIIL